WSDDPAPEHIQAASVEIVALTLLVANRIERRFRPDAFRLVGIHRGATDLGDEAATQGERLVTQHPSRETMTRTACEQFVVGVASKRFRACCCRLAIGAAGDDQAMQL